VLDSLLFSFVFFVFFEICIIYDDIETLSLKANRKKFNDQNLPKVQEEIVSYVENDVNFPVSIGNRDLKITLKELRYNAGKAICISNKKVGK
jgi:hypothetical protein